MELYIEESSRGVSQKTWDKMDSNKRREYLKANPTSRYAEKIANPDDTLPTQIKPRNLEKEVDDLRAENAELRQRLEALERFINGANPNLTPAQSNQVAKELEEKLSPEYTDKVNSIMDSLEDAYDSTLDDAIFGILDAFPELQDKFLSKGEGIGNIKPMSKEDKLELLSRMLKSLKKEDLDKVLEKIGANKEDKTEKKDDMEIMKEAYFKKFPDKKMKDFKKYIHPQEYYLSDGNDWLDYPKKDAGKFIDENGNITDYNLIDIADDFLGALRRFDLMTGMNLAEKLLSDDTCINNEESSPCDSMTLWTNISEYDDNYKNKVEDLKKDLYKFEGSPEFIKFSDKYGLKMNLSNDLDGFILLDSINDGGFNKYLDNLKKGSKDNNKTLTPEELINTLEQYGAKNITKNKDGSIDIEGDFNFHNRYCTEFDKLFLDKDGKLKIKFNKVSGNFYLPPDSKISSLEGCPKEVGGVFDCHGCNNLRSLEGSPEYVGENFYCSCCDNLISLKGAPKKIGRDFYSSYCHNLKSLKGAPKEIGEDFWCSDCGKKFTEDEVRHYSNVKGEIRCR